MKTGKHSGSRENERLRKENKELLRLCHLECQLFMRTDSYQRVAQKKHTCFNNDEQKQLQTDVHGAFTYLIQTLRESCTSLTNDDVIFCCLAKSGLDHSAICCCMGNVSAQAANQRKYRIRKKMREAQCEALFELIFKE